MDVHRDTLVVAAVAAGFKVVPKMITPNDVGPGQGQ
jgi:hypothetical protein